MRCRAPACSVVDGDRVAPAQRRDRHPRHARDRDPVRARPRATGSPRPPPPSSPTAPAVRVRRRARRGGAMNLVLDIAVTHVRHRARQTLVAVAGVMTGVGFSIMMAALMEGSQDDFMRQLIDALPHITVSDERRNPTAAAGRDRPTRRPRSTASRRKRGGAASRTRWRHGFARSAGYRARSRLRCRPRAILRYASRDVAASITGIDPHREPKVSALVAPDAPGHAHRRSTGPPTRSSWATAWPRRSAPGSAPTSRCRPATARA